MIGVPLAEVPASDLLLRGFLFFSIREFNAWCSEEFYQMGIEMRSYEKMSTRNGLCPRRRGGVLYCRGRAGR